MRPAHSAPADGAFSRRFTAYAGIYFDEFATDSAWLRETGALRLPPLHGVPQLVLRGEYRPHPAARGLETGAPTLSVFVNGGPAATLTPQNAGPWELTVPVPAAQNTTLTLALGGVGTTNFLAWLGRVTGFGAWQRFRAQNKNRQLRLRTIGTAAGEIIFDFARRDAPFAREYVRRHAQLGMNIAGFLTADLGVGESARCMVRAADAAGIPAALVPLKLNCKNRLGDLTFQARLQETNPHDVNVIHVDPPASRDIDHHHGASFRAGKYNVGYFAWELPEFPEAWVPSLDYYDEIWCPSDFTTRAIAEKSPVPVLTMPHAIAFARPAESRAQLRAKFGLPAESFLFLTLFDLNSYSARKNPRAVIEAFRRAALPAAGAAPAGLVIKVQNVAGNEADFSALQQSVRDLAGAVLITDTLSRADIYALEAACDAFVSLHRSEGFGLAIAESMYLGKPVIATDWSATAEYLNATNGCPVRVKLVTLDQNHGPYAKGSTWADPDPVHAAEHMRRLFDDRAFATALGSAARTTIETHFAPAVIGARYRRRLEAIAAF
jgi:glycosyltransferase involved in cell wall biosynthesis